jgi:signal transduction histidine kinase
VLASDETEWNYSYRFLRADGSVANVLSNRIILRGAGGKAYRILGSLHDISKQKVLEEKLEQEIKLKEKKIAEALQDAKDTERSDIGRELHDNITQLLGVSKLYLDMAKSGGENSEMYLSRSSEYTLTAIEEIRKLSKELTANTIKNFGLCGAIENIVRDTMEVNPVKISCALESFIEYSVNNKFKHNVYRIVQEQLNNILKHAKATEVVISLSQNEKSIMLTISDNGVGFDTGKKRKGIGIDNIKSRATSYNGTADFVSQPGQGCVLTVTFPVTDKLVSNSVM